MKMIKIYCILLVSIYAQLAISAYAQLPIIISEPENIYEGNDPDYIHDHGPFAPNYLDSVAATLKMDDSNIFLFHSSAFYTFKTWGPLDDPKKNVIGLDDYSGLHTKYFEIPLRLTNSISTNFAVGEKNFAAIFLKNVYDVGNGELIGFLHLEYMKGDIQFTKHGGPGYPGYPAIYTIGLCYSNNNGNSWTFCGDIIRQNDYTVPDSGEIDPAKNIGGAPYVINGDHIYVYFNEKATTLKHSYASVAKANLNAVISAAQNSNVVSWKKYNSATDDFDQDGLNGLGSPIIYGAADMHADAAYNSYINKYMLIAPYKINTDSGLRLFLSDDGIHFDDESPILLISSPNGIIGDLTYPFFVSLNSDANSDCSVVGREFYVYYSGTDYDVPEFPMSRLKVTMRGILEGPIQNPANSHTYYLLEPGITWEQAEAEANSLGGHLVTINDAAEQDWVWSTFGEGKDRWLWIGINDVAVEGNFVWASGETVTYTNWAPGEPNDSGAGEDYGEMDFNSGGEWNDLPNDAWTDLHYGVVEIGICVELQTFPPIVWCW